MGGCMQTRTAVIIVLVVQIIMLALTAVNFFMQGDFGFTLYIIKVVFVSLSLCCVKDAIWVRIVALVLFVVFTILALVGTALTFVFKNMYIKGACDTVQEQYDTDAEFRAEFNQQYDVTSSVMTIASIS